MRIGLVLGAGGVLGAAWHVGALNALSSETGWKPGEADCIVGTSAGAAIGCLIADGVDPEFLAAYAGGGALDEFADMEERADALAERPDGSTFQLARALPPIGPGSLRMAVATLRHFRRHSPATVLAGWLPRGFVSTRPIVDVIERFVPGNWPEHPSFWAVAADYGSGGRVPFGRPGAPRARAADAVAASCAIPGFYHPVSIDGRRYVDGGICSPSNLDLLRDAKLDLAVCLSPMSSLPEIAAGSPAERVAALVRAGAGRRLEHEAKKLRAAGTEVLVLHPGAADIAAMGVNMMARGRRVEVVEQAYRNTAVQLRELRSADQLLPGRSRRRPRPQRPAVRPAATAARGRAKAAA